MSMSVLNNFNTFFSQWLENNALPHLVTFLSREKGVNISIDDLRKALDLPALNGSGGNPFPSVMGFQNAVVSAPTIKTAAAAPKRGRKASPDGPTCKYKFTKGKPEKVGTPCGKPALAYEYCRACINKSDAKADLSKAGVTVEEIEMIKKGNITLLKQVPSNVPTIAPTKPAISVPQMNKPNLRKIDEEKRLYTLEELPLSLFIKPDPDPESDYFICIGSYNNNGIPNPRPLTPEEEKIVMVTYGFTYKFSGDPEPQTSSHEVPRAPLVHSIPSVPLGSQSVIPGPPQPNILVAPPIVPPKIPQGVIPVFNM